MIHQKTLSNGLTILCEQVSTAPVVALQAWVGVGSADELATESGLAHLHEHMLFKGTRRRGVGQVAREIEANGGEVNAWTSFDETVYHVTMASRYFETGLDVLADAVQNSIFDPEELAREKEVVLEEIRRGEDQPSRRLSQKLLSSVFRRHPYGVPIIGTSESVSSFSRRQILNFYKKWYVPNNITFVVVGDVDPDKAINAVTKAFGKAARRKLRRPARPTETLPRSPRTFAEIADAGDAYIGIGVPITPVNHPDTPGLDVLADILGGTEASRLFEKVQAERGLVSHVYAYAYTPKNPGVLMIGGNPFAGKELEAVKAIWEEVERLREGGVADAELDRAKLGAEAQSHYLRETVQGRARKWGFSFLEAGDLNFEEKYLDHVRALRCDDLARIARQYLLPERVSAGLIVPERTTRGKKAPQEKKIREDLFKVFKSAARATPKPAAAGAAKSSKPQAELHTFRNGVRVVIERNREVPIATFKLACLGGSRFEAEARPGVYHFVAEMLARGAGNRTAQQIREEAEQIAGGADGFTGRNTTGVDVHCLSRFWDRGLALLRDLALSPNFPEEEIAKVRNETIAGLERETDSMTQVLFNSLRQTLYGDHPYGYRMLGEREIVESLDRGELKDAHKRLLAPGRMVISAVGDLDPDAVLKELESTFGALETSASKAPQPALAPLTGRLYTERVFDRQQAHLAMGFRGTTLDSSERFAIDVMNTILSGQGGRLFTQLRDELSLAYSVGSIAAEGIEPGLIAGYIGTAPEKLSTAFHAMREQFDRMREKTPAGDELQRAKRHLVGTHAIDLQTSESRASLYSLNELYGLGYAAHEEYAANINKVTAKHVREVAERFLEPERAVLAVVRPERIPSLEAEWLGEAAEASRKRGATREGSRPAARAGGR